MSERVEVALYTVEKVGITQDGRLGTTIEEIELNLADAAKRCDERGRAEGVAYSSTRIVVEVEDPPPGAEIVTRMEQP